MFGAIFTGFIMMLVSAFMFGIGIVQLKSKRPVGFYSGETGPKPEELTDVDAWNKKHGWMWIIYGIIILLTEAVGFLLRDTNFVVIPFMVGLIVPVFFMMWYHNRLIQRYYVKK